jgi:tetratricopeptide (TPR) repeat protein
MKRNAFCLKIIFLFFILLAFGTTTLVAQKFEELCRSGTAMEKQLNEKKALYYFGEAQKLNPTDLKVLYKCSELCGRIGARETNKTSKEKYFTSSLSFAQMALKHHPQSDESNLAVSIAQGRIALSKSGKEKVNAVKEIKLYAQRAININPNNAKAWHVLGKWYFEVSSLNFVEKAAIKIIYGGLPDASFEKAVQAYEKAAALSPHFLLNFLELAKAYEKLDQKSKAVSCLIKIKEDNTFTEDDLFIKKQAEELLQQWQ